MLVSILSASDDDELEFRKLWFGFGGLGFFVEEEREGRGWRGEWEKEGRGGGGKGEDNKKTCI